ncbi:CFA44 protein, partial [Smithornis capensis]|nr:CFA44 protein [Smithornis capensis]
MQNGSLRVYPLQDKDLSVNTMKEYWCFTVHDNDYGQIQGICSSYDDRFLITCGGDGNIFTFNILSPEDVPVELKAKIPFPRRGLEKEKATEDIEDPNAYNIEEVKQRKEFERIMKEAEEKKNKKREELISLRHDFVFLLQKNQELPKHMQLHRKEYEMDCRIFEELDRQRAQRIQLVQKELAWEHEKQLIGLQKLQKQFRDSLELIVVVHAIQSNHQISTYRLLTMYEKYGQDKEQVDIKWSVFKDKVTVLKKEEEAEEMEITTETRDMHRDTTISEDEAENLEEIPEARKPTARYIESKCERVRRIAEKSDKIKAKIMKKRAQWDELNKSKPSDDYENPMDAEEIKEAQENIGCYRLKTASDYKLPEHEYMNTEKKLMQMAFLEDLIHRKKENMNKEIMSLRDLKISIIDEIKCLVQELKTIQATLDLSERLPLPLVPQLHPNEVPEKKFECSSDILLKFKEEQAKAELKKQLDGSPSFRAFRHGFLSAPSVEEVDPAAQAAGVCPTNMASSVGTEQQKVFEMETAEPTEMQLEILKREKIKNLYLQEALIKKINMLVINFDAELRLLRHKKLKMDVQMKSGDLRYITCCEELLILKELEKHENHLQERIYALLSEQEAIKPELENCLTQMEDRKHEIVKLQKCEKALYANFKASLGENNEFAHFLTNVLKKKIKCVEKKEVEREADEEDDNGEDSDMKTGEENSGSEVFNDSVCPDGCDEALFLNTIQLQQQRVDIEKALAEEKKAAADLSKECNALTKKAKEVENSLDATKRELEIFQWEKLRRLNELYVAVPLKLHQVQCLVNGEMPSDFSQALVFTNQSLEYLQKRVEDLRNEKRMQREIYKKAREQHKQLVRDKKEMEREIRQLEKKCNHLMMEKFGRLVDFDAVQEHSANIPMEEMKVKIMEKEYEHYVELKEWESRIVELQQQLMKVTKENTSKLQQLNEFCCEKHQLETKLDSLTDDLGVEFQGTQTADTKVRARLELQLTHMARDTAFLKEEINQARRGGWIKDLTVLGRKSESLSLKPSPQDYETRNESLPALKP